MRREGESKIEEKRGEGRERRGEWRDGGGEKGEKRK